MSMPTRYNTHNIFNVGRANQTDTRSMPTRYSTNNIFTDVEMHGSRLPALAPPAKTTTKKRCRRFAKYMVGVILVLGLVAGGSALTISIMLPNVEEMDDFETKEPTPLAKFVDQYANEEVNKHPPIDRGEQENAPSDRASNEGPPSSPISRGDGATDPPHDDNNVTTPVDGGDSLDLLVLDEQGDGVDSDVERRLTFSELAKEYLRRHQELLQLLEQQTQTQAQLLEQQTQSDGDANTTDIDRRRRLDDRREVGWKPSGSHKSVVRLTHLGTTNPFKAVGCQASGFGCGGCSGTLVDDDTVLTAAHCVYAGGKWKHQLVEVAPTESGNGWKPWEKHTNCASSVRIPYPCGVKYCTRKAYYPCGVRHCRRCWGPRWARKCGSYPCGTNTCGRDVSYPCGTKWCHRTAEPPKCTWRYTSKQIWIPSAWTRTPVGRSDADGQTAEHNQWDIAIIKLHPTRNKHAGSRAGWKTPRSVNFGRDLANQRFEITGYPASRGAKMMTSTGTVSRAVPGSGYRGTVVEHDIDSSGGQSGSGLAQGNNVYGVHIAQSGGVYKGEARIIDPWWYGLMRSKM